MFYSQFVQFYFVLRNKLQKRARIKIVLRHALEDCSIRLQCLRKRQKRSSECKKRANKRIQRIRVNMPSSHMILTSLHSLRFRKLKYQCIFVESGVRYLCIHAILRPFHQIPIEDQKQMHKHMLLLWRLKYPFGYTLLHFKRHWLFSLSNLQRKFLLLSCSATFQPFAV